MMKRFQIIVEGDADKKFFENYYHHLFHEKATQGSITHPGKDGEAGGYQKLKYEDSIRAMQQNTDLGGVNLVIFDADEDPEARRKELLAIKKEFGVEFDLFLLPNDKDAGALEDLLENIINPNNLPVMDCWQTYEGELEKVRIPTKTPPTLTIPAKKTKIYAYLETLLGKSKTQKKLIKEVNRDYENTQHWNLDAEYLEPLKEFLKQHLQEKQRDILLFQRRPMFCQDQNAKRQNEVRGGNQPGDIADHSIATQAPGKQDCPQQAAFSRRRMHVFQRAKHHALAKDQHLRHALAEPPLHIRRKGQHHRSSQAEREIVSGIVFCRLKGNQEQQQQSHGKQKAVSLGSPQNQKAPVQRLQQGGQGKRGKPAYADPHGIDAASRDQIVDCRITQLILRQIESGPYRPFIGSNLPGNAPDRRFSLRPGQCAVMCPLIQAGIIDFQQNTKDQKRRCQQKTPAIKPFQQPAAAAYAAKRQISGNKYPQGKKIILSPRLTKKRGKKNPRLIRRAV